MCWFFAILLACLDSAEAEPPPEEPSQDALRLQIFLDQQMFRPGKLDNRKGPFTETAAARMAQARGWAGPDDVRQAARSSLPGDNLLTEYAIREEDFSFIGPLPESPEALAKLDFLPYPSLAEFVAERYHADVDYVRRLNPGVDFGQLAAGSRVKVPAVEPFRIEAIWPKKAGNASSPPEDKAAEDAETAQRKSRVVNIDRTGNILEVTESDRLVASFPITVGAPGNETPAGAYTIREIVRRPTFRYDEKMLEEGVRSDDAHLLPPGPRNPVGVIWVQLSRDGIGIHGTRDPDLIGRNQSAGCIRLSNWDVAAFVELVAPGGTVNIR